MPKNKAHFHGIKGVGMTSLALAMQDQGWQISGSDTNESFITDEILLSRQIPLSPLKASIPSDTNLVIYSGAYPPPATSIRTLSLAQALAEFVASRQVIAVAGVGGKTTITAMLAVLMRTAGRKVGYYIGTGSIPGLPTPGAAGEDPYFVIEADEYAISKDDHRPKFALLSPHILITTNIIHDHPDIYPDIASTQAVFLDLLNHLPPQGVWLYYAADPLTQTLQKELSTFRQDLKLIPYGPDHPLYSKLELKVFGTHNRLDALAAVLAAQEAGLSEAASLSAITSYRGAMRRQEKIGEVNDRVLYDDYGHHPEEIEATVKAFRAQFPAKRLVLVFESHTYSRTEMLFDQFAAALALADLVFVMPIFESAREKGKPHTVSHLALAAAINQHQPIATAVEWETAASTIAKASKPGDLLLTMGAGFVYKLHQELKKLL